jgi:uncharacterized protein YjiK
MLLKFFLASLFLVYLAVQTCGNQPKKATNTVSATVPYDLSTPTTSFNLDASLHEISGLSATANDRQLACLQDESGQLFYIDTKTGQSTPSVIFQNSGDFEGIEFVNNTLWATTSKGKLYKIWNLDKTPFDFEIIKIESLKKANIEGLGYDKLNNRLLLAAKGDKADGATLRTVWAFDLQNQTPSPIESGFRTSTVLKAFDIQLSDFQDFLKNKTEPAYAKLIKDYIETPSTTGFEFGPSGIAVHPLNGHIYIVSSVNKVLLVLSADGKILDMVKLDKTLFQQPEGLCFSPDGTLYISNEAKDNPTASLLVFKMK